MFAYSPFRSSSSSRRQRNVAVLGSSQVGKTSTCLRFVKNQFEEVYNPTYQNSFSKVVKRKGYEIEWLIKDTQGTSFGLSDREIFSPEYSVGYHGYVLVYRYELFVNLQNVGLTI
jgi:Ras family protein